MPGPATAPWPSWIGGGLLPPEAMQLKRVAFESLPGYAGDDLAAAWSSFLRSARSIADGASELRTALTPPESFCAICRKALRAGDQSTSDAATFFTNHFEPWRIVAPAAFLTGYYEPVVPGSLVRTKDFTEPLFARPADLNAEVLYADRAAIEAAGLSQFTPVIWLRDAIEVFMIQVQGSAAVDLPDGQRVRLTYAGRNGQPYTSIGRILIETDEIPEPEMSLARLKQWVRDHGQAPGQPGRALLHRNRSYVFFSRDGSENRAAGPIGGAGVPLSPLRSIAVDRTVWPYGLPVFVDADLPDSVPNSGRFQKLMIGQDTGSAIVGPARIDLFIGSGDAAGVRAGQIRNSANLYVFLPKTAGLLS